MHARHVSESQLAAGSSASTRSDRQDAGEWLDLGAKLSKESRFAEAESCFRAALRLHAGNPMCHNNLAWAREMQGQVAAAIAGYEQALALDSQFLIARRNLSRLVARGDPPERLSDYWWSQAATDHCTLERLAECMAAALISGNLALAFEYARVHTALRWGSQSYPLGNSGRLPQTQPRITPAFLTTGKLRHDIEQFEYLQRLGRIGHEFNEIIQRYHRCLERLAPFGEEARLALNQSETTDIGEVYNRITHLHNAARVPQALSDTWDRCAAQERYSSAAPSLLVVDDFLTREALSGLRAFCLESTIWSRNHYAEGRLGSFFGDGFNCELLLQIAEELAVALPRIVGQLPLRQIWAFKYPTAMSGNNTHADFAAVNVNFWITSDEANLDPDSGGMIVYDVSAPKSWRFQRYNRKPDAAKAFLDREGARAINIPYRANRAVIFSSDLFHATAPVRFRSGYQHRRINVTLLYGDRSGGA